MASSLPEFENPPLIEVALSVQFERLESLRSPQLGLVWQQFRDRFPKTEEHAPLDPVFEQFGSRPGRPGVRLELVSAPPSPRLWFLNEAGTELVQVQKDRFVRNWRKQADADEYPRYRRLSRLFRDDFERFCRLIEEQQWGQVVPSQCEVTYVNLIAIGEGWKHHGELANVVTLFEHRYSDTDLGVPEEAALSVKYVLNDDDGNPIGRLHIAAAPVFRAQDNLAAVRLALTARGKPEDGGIEEVMRFFDRARENIVRGFTSITTPRMHLVWNRTS
jgi:uncharacterized protein (TIGR04255 family)